MPSLAPNALDRMTSSCVRPKQYVVLKVNLFVELLTFSQNNRNDFVEQENILVTVFVSATIIED